MLRSSSRSKTLIWFFFFFIILGSFSFSWTGALLQSRWVGKLAVLNVKQETTANSPHTASTPPATSTFSSIPASHCVQKEFPNVYRTQGCKCPGHAQRMLASLKKNRPEANQKISSHSPCNYLSPSSTRPAMLLFSFRLLRLELFTGNHLCDSHIWFGFSFMSNALSWHSKLHFSGPGTGIETHWIMLPCGCIDYFSNKRPNYRFIFLQLWLFIHISRIS